MTELLSEVSAGFSLWERLKSVWKVFRPATLEVIGIDQEWVGNMLIHYYKFRMKKPRLSRVVSKVPMPLDIPQHLGIAEFRLDLPQVQTRSVNIPASKIDISAYDLIGDFLDTIHDGQEIQVSLRIPCSFQDIAEVEVSRKENFELCSIKNPNNFHLKSYDFSCRVLADEPIREIEIVKGGTVVSDKSLVTITKTIHCDFKGDKLIDYFPTGISASENEWFSHNRTEMVCELKFTLNLDPNEEMEIRLYRGKH